MTWKKNSGGRKTGRWYGQKTPTRKMWRAIQKKAPRRYNWVTALDSPCQWLSTPWHACGNSGGPPEDEPANGSWSIDPSTGLIEVDPVTGDKISAAPLSFDLFAPDDPVDIDERGQVDDITIVRTVGFIDFFPQYLIGHRLNEEETVPDCIQKRAVAQYSGYFFRAGLKKDDWVLDPKGETYSKPRRDPLQTQDWTDGRFSKMWQKEAHASASTEFGVYQCTSDVIGICSNTTGVINPVTGGGGVLAAGSGTIANNAGGDGVISTACFPLKYSVEVGSATTPETRFQNGESDRKFRISLSSRKRIRLRENEGWSLWFNFTAPDRFGYISSSDLHSPAVRFLMRAHVKLCIETA